MPYTSVFDLFKVGLGPSSSHTVGPMLAAAEFARLGPSRVTVHLYGSLALTGIGHGTDRALVLGLGGHHPESVPLDLVHRARRQVIEEGGLDIDGRVVPFHPDENIVRVNEIHPAHANVLAFFAPEGERWYASIGGGFIAAVQGDAVVLEDRAPSVPIPFETSRHLLDACATTGLSVEEVVAENEGALNPSADLAERLRTLTRAMNASIDRGLSSDGLLPGGLGVERRASRLGMELDHPPSSVHLPPSGPTDWAGVWAIAVNEENAAGGRIVTAPTNGAAGIIPAVMRYLDTFCRPTARDPHRAFLFTAGAIGSLIKQGAGISGAELGCQGEVGAACSMAAAGLAAALGGSPTQVENAAEIALEHNLGLTCDPVGGLVQIPCIERNAIGAVKAITATSLALRGSGRHIVSLDAAIETLRETGADMDHKYKETSLGGLAVSVPAC